jgi:hypothetical protein
VPQEVEQPRSRSALLLLAAGLSAIFFGAAMAQDGAKSSPGASAAPAYKSGQTSKPPAEPAGENIRPPDKAAEGEAKTPDKADPPETPQQRIERWKRVDWEAMVQRDQLEFLRNVRQKCDETTVDFTATFHKRERIRGDLRDEEAAQMKWRAKPFSVYMKYVKGDKGREALYVDGQNDGKMLVHPGGLLGGLIQLKLDPASERVMKDNLRPITMAGIVNMINTALPPFELALANGDLKTEYLGRMDVAGRRAYGIKRILPKKDIYPCKELVLFVDCDLLIPIGADSYGWDGQLESSYRYTDVRLNVGLGDIDFSKKNKAYNF